MLQSKQWDSASGVCVSCMTSFIVSHIIESSRFIFVLMTLNFATLTTLLTFRPTWHTPHLEWSNDIIVTWIMKWSFYFLVTKKNWFADFAGLMDFPNVHFRKFLSFYNDVSTSLVDLPAKLTGLRTSGKHAKPQRAEFQVHGLGVTTSHRSAPATITPHPMSATSHPHHQISTDNISFLLKTMQCWLVFEDLQRNLSTRQTVGLGTCMFQRQTQTLIWKHFRFWTSQLPRLGSW